MAAQNRRRRHGADLTFEAGFYGLRLALVGYDGENFVGLENLARGHGEGSGRHLRNVGEPGFANLLLAAGVIEIYDDVGAVGGEISGRIVEGDVPILSNPKEGDVDGSGGEFAADLPGNCRRIGGVAFEQVIRSEEHTSELQSQSNLV